LNKHFMAPAIIVAIGAAIAGWLILNPNTVSDETSTRVLPKITITTPQPVTEPLIIESQGTVEPANTMVLSAEIAARITEVADNFQRGNAFSAGDVLIRLEDTDAKLGREQAAAQLAQARIDLRIASNELDRATELFQQQLVSRQNLEQAQLRHGQAEAQLAAASVSLAQAELTLERTIIKAPFNGRIEQEMISVGQFVARGEPIALLIELNYFEIRLPISRAELAYLDIPFSARGLIDEALRPKVILSGEFGGQDWIRKATLVRTEALIDAGTQQVFAVARLPINLDDADTLIPLGLFVRAKIEGVLPKNAYRLPRSSLGADKSLLVVDMDNRLWQQPIEIIRLEHDHVIISQQEITPNSRIAMSGLRTIVDGMHIEPVQATSR
jgi:RND family efflux transporter, MFP subunit